MTKISLLFSLVTLYAVNSNALTLMDFRRPDLQSLDCMFTGALVPGGTLSQKIPVRIKPEADGTRYLADLVSNGLTFKFNGIIVSTGIAAKLELYPTDNPGDGFAFDASVANDTAMASSIGGGDRGQLFLTCTPELIERDCASSVKPAGQ